LRRGGDPIAPAAIHKIPAPALLQTR
jgi:hypothetical protein